VSQRAGRYVVVCFPPPKRKGHLKARYKIIRGADISGTSVRGEIGATFRPGEKSNVTIDLNLSGFAGKKQGLTRGLSVVFHI